MSSRICKFINNMNNLNNLKIVKVFYLIIFFIIFSIITAYNSIGEEFEQGIFDSVLPHENINRGKFYESAKLIVIDKNTGHKQIISVKKGKGAEFESLVINLSVCWKQDGGMYNPQSKAFVEIINTENNSVIFSHWLFSNDRAISNPYYKKYFFVLKECA